MDPRYAKTFKEIEESPDTDITDAAFLDDKGDPKPALITHARELQWILQTLCTRSASAMLRRGHTSHGFELWRKFYNRYRIPTKARAAGGLTQTREPSGVERGIFEDALAAMDDEILRYQTETDLRLSDDD